MKEKKFCVLAVDDSTDILEIVKLSLETKTDWRVLTSSSGEEALLQAKKELPDIILLDLQMPKINGIDTAKKLKACPKTNKIPIVFLTGSSYGVSPETLKQISAFEVIKKPSDWFGLAESIMLSFRSLSIQSSGAKNKYPWAYDSNS